VDAERAEEIREHAAELSPRSRSPEPPSEGAPMYFCP
jgi:hypothetical protein